MMTVGLRAGTRQTGILRPLPPPAPAGRRRHDEEHKPVHAHPGEH